MDAEHTDELARSVAWLEASLAPCRTRPELHAHQIAAFERYLAMARSASSAGDYAARVKADGDMFEINRALALDRYANSVRLHRALGDDRLLRAAFAGLRAAREATGHADLASRLAAAQEGAEPLVRAARITTGHVRDLFASLLDWAMQADPSMKAHHLSEVRRFWGLIRESDPDCTFDKLCSYPPYRRRIPFSDGRLALLGRWLREAVG